MKILSINKAITYDTLSITNINESTLATQANIEAYDYIIINGGDGTIRRVVKILDGLQYNASIILNPTGSFNVIAKLHRAPALKMVLKKLSESKALSITSRQYYRLNEEVFLFSAGNMGDLQHIFLSETLRFGVLKKGMAKYILAGFFLVPAHLIMTPFMLLSPRRFFVLTPASFIGKFGSFYGRVTDTISIDLENHYNLVELDGDVVTIKESIFHITPAGSINIAT